MCEGIAKTVKALCDAVGLPCIVALSEAAPERGVKYRHTWNVVTVEGQRYHLDATFDNSHQPRIPPNAKSRRHASWCSSRTRETNCKYIARMFYYRTKPNSRTDGHDTAEERTVLKIN